MLLALSTVRQEAAAPIKHLRAVNPYVGAALATNSQRLSLPREHAPVQLTAQSRTAGTSSFGMSGVNAHLLLTSSAASTDSMAMRADQV